MPRTRPELDRSAAPTRITSDKWLSAREALADTRDRFEELVADVNPRAMVTPEWTVMDTAAHVTGIAWLDTVRMAPGNLSLPIAGLHERILATTVDNVHDLNANMLQDYSERDRDRVLGRLRSSVDEILRLTATDDPARTAGWLGGSRLPMSGFVTHLTNELLIHGRDIARSLNRPWVIPERDAALFFELFLIEIIRNGHGHILDDDRPVFQGRIAVEFRSAYTVPVTIVLDTGRVSAEEPSRDNDVRVYFRPSTMSLVLFHRVARSRAAMTGALYVWGRHPWLLVPFLRKVRLP